jgi:hypothetical protein
MKKSPMNREKERSQEAKGRKVVERDERAIKEIRGRCSISAWNHD